MKSTAVLLASWISWAALHAFSTGARRNEHEHEHNDDDDDERLESLLEHLLASDSSRRAAVAAAATATATATAATSEQWNAPYFEDAAVDGVNVTSQFGNDVILHCRVHNVSDKVVSWLRRADDGMRLLSYDKQAYISDGRYQMEFREPNDWQLRIRYANERDEGHYECQVSSHPPVVSRVYLKIQVPELEIADERESPIRNKFYGVGSTIELKCVITKVAHHPDAFVTWRHGTRILNYDTVRGGINVKTEILADGAQSRLFVANAKTSDSGNYTCSLADVATTYVTVQVLNGETPAAMQRGGGSDRAKFHRVTILLIVVRVVDQYR